MASVTIVGAGPVGTLLAVLLARRGTRVHLVERREDPRRHAPERGRSINLALASRGLRVLEQAGLLPAIAPLMVEMPGRLLHDEGGALKFLRYGQFAGESIFAVGRAPLAAALVRAAAAEPLIEMSFARRCLDVDPATHELVCHDESTGRTVREPFERLIGADGAGSAVRASLARLGLVRVREAPLAHDYKELVIPARAGGYVFEPHALHIWPRGGFMLIALPDPGGTFTATLFLPRSGEPSFERLRAPSDVQRFFDTQFPDAARAVPDLAAQFEQHPQSHLATVHCAPWQHEERIVLIGDAAHAIVPFHGQGLNCGFEDCAQLLACLDTPAPFERFESARRPNSEAIAAISLENYVEMRDAVRASDFESRQGLAAELERRFPGRFIPRYSMVMFHPEIAYAEAQRRGAAQERILDALGARFGYGPLGEAAAREADSLLGPAPAYARPEEIAP